jgi:ABC-type transport system involved in cytochrome c biogenesis permease subunit
MQVFGLHVVGQIVLKGNLNKIYTTLKIIIMIIDVAIFDFLKSRKINDKLILFLITIYYVLLYYILYTLVIKRVFFPSKVLIPCFIIFVFFIIYRIVTLEKYSKSNI